MPPVLHAAATVSTFFSSLWRHGVAGKRRKGQSYIPWSLGSVPRQLGYPGLNFIPSLKKKMRKRASSHKILGILVS